MRYKINGFVVGILLAPILWFGYKWVTAPSHNLMNTFPSAKVSLLDINFVPTTPPVPVPDQSFIELTAEKTITQSLSEKKGKALLIHFWAPWCSVCIAELPAFAQFATQQKGSNYDIISIANDPSRGSTKSQECYRSKDIKDLALYVDKYEGTNGLLAQDFDIYAYPTTIIISPEGKEIGRIVGPVEWDAQPGALVAGIFKQFDKPKGRSSEALQK